jgi:hypothetical protein
VNDKNIIFHVEGGIGKNIMATAVAKAIKKKNPDRDIITISSWPAIWFNNPNVERFYQLGNTPYIFEDYIRDKDTLIMKQEPYHHHGYINKKVHCIQAWCELLGVEYSGEKPEIYLTHSESEQARMQFGSSDKPIFLIQTNGGPMGPDRAPMSWVRDAPLPTVLKMIEPFAEDYNLVQIRTENQPGFQDMPWVASPNIREIIALLKWSSKRLLIDSFAQHACMSLGKKATVLWPMDNSKSLGYEFHDNIVSNVKHEKTHLIESYLGDLDISGQPHMCPFKDDDIFDVDKVVKSLKRQKDTKFPKSMMNMAPQQQQQQPQACPSHSPQMQPQMQPQMVPQMPSQAPQMPPEAFKGPAVVDVPES